MTLHPAGAPGSAANPLVSIVWFGKNRVQSVEQEVGSVLKQDHGNWELVVEDGGSTDGTLAWFARLAVHDKRIAVASTLGTKPGPALLRALRRCNGDYIAICPNHAGFAANALEHAIQVLERSPDAGALACRGLLVDPKGDDAPVPFDIVMALFTPLRIAPHGGIIRRSALVESGLLRDDWRLGCMALDVWCRLAMDHEIAASDVTLVEGKALPCERDFDRDSEQVVEDRIHLVEALFDREGFFWDTQEDLALGYECMANQLGVMCEEGYDERAIARRSKALAAKFARILGWDQRAERSLARWRRLWFMSDTLEALPGISGFGTAPSFDVVAACLPRLSKRLRLLARPFIRATLPKRSREFGDDPAGDLRALFADVYANQAERHNGLGQVEIALRNWRLAEVLGDSMCDSMALQAELKRPGATEASLAEFHKRWVARHIPGAAAVEPRGLHRWDGRRKIRIGYHCAFMHNDTMRYMMARVLGAHDKQRFELFGYSPYPVPEDIARGFDVLRHTTASTDDPERIIFHNSPMISHAAFRRMILDDRIDVLVELTGFSPGHRFEAMAARCAPVQVSFLNHTASSQVPNVDYVLADEISLPASAGFEPYYSEKIHRLPGCFFCFDYRGYEYPDVADPPCVAKGYVTFGCFGSGGKLNREQLRMWADLLHQIPTARLRLQNTQLRNQHGRRFFTERFRSFGIEPDRLVLAHGVDRQALLKVYGEVDISLDTWPYCGGNTIAESLWQGVPVITLQGDRFSSRYGASLLAAAGCADLVAKSPEQYIAIAKRLAGDPARLAELRRHLRHLSIEHGLGDSVRFARRLEDAYVDMLSRAAK
jgi:hypothetical protein